MASDALKEERSKLHESAINEHQLATDEGTGTDLIQCRRYDSILFNEEKYIERFSFLDVNKIIVHIQKLKRVVQMNQ